jgi:hypothetical protein
VPEAFLGGLQALLLKQQQALLESLAQKMASSSIVSSPTPATLGLQAHTDLVKLGRWNSVEKSGSAVLDDCQSLELAALKCVDESELIQWFTPHLQRVVASASKRMAMPLALVNTERHAWVDDPHKGAPSKPDMLVAHPAFWKLNKTDGDETYDGQEFLFGQCAHFDLRDSVTAIMEWKVEMTSGFKALGEGIEYAQRLSHADPEHPCITADDVSIVRVIVADRHHFQLLTCMRGHAESCVEGCWAGPGSFEALVSFLTPEQPPWVTALEAVFRRFQLKFQPGDCFLGRGGTGRVFSVLQGEERLAVKVSIRDNDCTMLAAEKAAYDKHCQPELTVSSVDWFMDSDRRFAALLLGPVGVKLPLTKKAISAAIKALFGLANARLLHGDARFPNVVWVDGERALWLDLRTLQPSTDPAVSCTHDIITFGASLGLENAIKEHFRNKPLKLCAEPEALLLSVFSQLWGTKR